MFVDTTRVRTIAGKGGDGCMSFRREAFVPKGGPDGGDGGRGGSIILKVTRKVTTLAGLARNKTHRAQNGKPGQGRGMTGRSGKDLVLKAPPGTIMRDAETGEVIRDLLKDGEKIVLAAGGKGGRGNKQFATATDQAPRTTTKGEPGEDRSYVFELKMIADIGLVGLPNAGKSTILRKVSRARPQSRNYPFTTLRPSLGVVSTDETSQLVWADLPGLIEGAHAGKGLGDEFLRHVERTRALVHVIDVAGTGDADPERAYRIIREELQQYSAELASKPEIVALSKIDLLEEAELDDPLMRLARAYEVNAEAGEAEGPLDPERVADRGRAAAAALAQKIGKVVIPVSSRTGAGLGELIGAAAKLCPPREDAPDLDDDEEPPPAEPPERRVPPHRRPEPSEEPPA